MTRNEAIDRLSQIQLDPIADLYDVCDWVVDALEVLVPGYEYPDVAWKTGVELVADVTMMEGGPSIRYTPQP